MIVSRPLPCLVIAGALIAGAALQPVQAKILAQWVQLGPDGTASVRAITDGSCPAVAIDGRRVPMRVRSDPDQKVTGVPDARFPVRGCEAQLPIGAASARLDGKPLPLPRANPRRIMMFGDTGCRLSRYDSVQNCNDPNGWPFPRIAAVAAAAHPDLVIHVGDYAYREIPCPADQAGCAGTPWGYGWDSWNADFFAPAAPLLAAAPWVLVRGNHEDCRRAGEGWFRFLDRAPMEAACREFSGIFVARLGDFGLVVTDSAKADDSKGDTEAMATLLRKQFAEVVPKVPSEAWLVTHRPFNGVSASERSPPTDEVDNKVLQRAFGPDMPAGMRMIVSGHIHFFQAVDFGGARPPQLVVGMGGDNLDAEPPRSLVGMDINGRPVVNATTHSRFGYMIWDRVGAVWSGTLFDVRGTPVDRCRLSDRSLICGP